MARTLLQNCHLITPGVNQPNAAILIDNGQIAAILDHSTQLPDADNVIDCENNWVMPGFIDTHCHGRNNFDFCDGTVEAVRTLATNKVAEGVTTLLPTTLTLSEEILAKVLQSARDYAKNPDANGCKLPGVHLEGPFINRECLGAQNPAYVRDPDLAMVKRLNAIYPVLKISYAVELPGAAEFGAELLKMHITPSCVHSKATFGQFEAAYCAGVRNLSHYCNQMTPLHHRDIGLVGAGLYYDDTYAELICDKLHLCPEMIQLIFKLKKLDRLQLVTDAMRASGMPDGEYDLGGVQTFVKNGAARLAAGNLAGSTLQLNIALKNVYELTGLPLQELVRVTSLNQAVNLGLPKLGKLAVGYQADIAVLADDFSVRKTLVDGRLVYQK